MKNVGSIDRLVRIIVALGLAFAAATGVVTGAGQSPRGSLPLSWR